LTGVGAITGLTKAGSTLTAGALTPAAATVTYQWQSTKTPGDPDSYVNIAGATAKTYALKPGDVGM